MSNTIGNESRSEDTAIILKALDVMGNKNKDQYVKHVAMYYEKE